MTEPTIERVESAYGALASGDPARIAEFYHEDLRWLVPGNHPLAGRYYGRDAFLQMMERAAKLTGGTFAMEREVVLVGDGYSADLCRNRGHRMGTDDDSGSPFDHLDLAVIHVLRWSDGRIVEGRDGLFGDDATAFSQFWSPLAGNGDRSAEPSEE